MRLRTHGPLLGVFVIGGALRWVLLVAYQPAILNYPDTWGYVRAAAGPLFHDDDIRPVGYSLALRALHGLSSTVTFAILVQHVLGLAAAALMYATVRRLAFARWVAIAPAAVIAISPDVLYFEHSLLSETTFTFLVSATLYAITRALQARDEGGRESGWLAASAASAAAATTVRTVGLVLLSLVVLVVVVRRLPRRARVASLGVVALSIASVLGPYLVARQASTSAFGLSSAGGWALYSRAAPFADCRRFEPPPGTAVLCERTDPAARPGGDYYGWERGSPARQAFVGPPFNDEDVGAFGRAAILAQPWDYVRAVARDLWRFIDADAAGAPYSGGGPEVLRLEFRDPAAERLNRSVVEPYYGRYRTRIGSGTEVLADLQPVARVHGPLVLAAVALALFGIMIARDRQRPALVLFTGTAVGIPVFSVATAIYGWRYIVPVLPQLAAAGAMGASLLQQHVRSALARRRPKEPIPGLAAGGVPQRAARP